MSTDTQTLQRGHHKSPRQIHGGHRGRQRADRPPVHQVPEGTDAGAGDLPARQLPAGQAGQGASAQHTGAEGGETAVRRAAVPTEGHRQGCYVRDEQRACLRDAGGRHEGRL